MRRLGAGILRRGAGGALDEVAAVIDLSAHDHAQRALAAALDLETGAIAVGEAVGRKICRLHLAGTVEIDRAFDAGAGAFDQKILDADGLRLGVDRERGARRLAGRLGPAGQKPVDLRRGQIGLDVETALAIGPGGDMRPLSRIGNCAGNRLAHVEAEIAARGVVEHALQADFGVRLVSRLAVFKAHRSAGDLDVALELEALRSWQWPAAPPLRPFAP